MQFYNSLFVLSLMASVSQSMTLADRPLMMTKPQRQVMVTASNEKRDNINMQEEQEQKQHAFTGLQRWSPDSPNSIKHVAQQVQPTTTEIAAATQAATTVLQADGKTLVGTVIPVVTILPTPFTRTHQVTNSWKMYQSTTITTTDSADGKVKQIKTVEGKWTTETVDHLVTYYSTVSSESTYWLTLYPESLTEPSTLSTSVVDQGTAITVADQSLETSSLV
ncbi:unnamed protein product [Ambrosiozyma monospora]|uniref:Unnamed protein product n=1 Tax=Ambrosiozyma monospora TaxID=43982 RepID=A0A9W6YX10_AMBMO|nr:unnamed protein product [Ambrosiozyma monospora]